MPTKKEQCLLCKAAIKDVNERKQCQQCKGMICNPCFEKEMINEKGIGKPCPGCQAS